MDEQKNSASFQFVHAADLHLDTVFHSQSPALRRRLRDASEEAFAKLCRVARAKNNQALLIAGDAFDDQRLRFRTEALLIREFKILADAQVTTCMATGNHDPGGANLRAHQLAWPGREEGRFQLFNQREPQTHDLVDRYDATRRIARITSCGFEDKAEHENLAANFPPVSDQSLPHIAMLHTQCASAQSSSQHLPYAPSSLEDFRKGYAYWALGHVHQRQTLSENPLVAYSGNLIGRHFRELGPKGALKVILEPSTRGWQARSTFIILAPLIWHRLEFDQLKEVRDLEDLLLCMEERVAEIRQKNSGDLEHLVRFVLKGACPLAKLLRDKSAIEELVQVAAERLELMALEIDTKALSMPRNLDQHRGQTNLMGLALELLDAADNDHELLNAIAPKTLAGWKASDSEGRVAYLRKILSAEGFKNRLAEELLLEEDA